MRATYIMLAAASSLGGCETGGTSTTEMKAAAIERARQEAGLAANVPLEATVWTGVGQHDDQIVLCGTVSGESGATRIAKRFAATGVPIRWLAFEDAHDPMIRSQPNKFIEWQQVCADGARGE